MEATWGGRRLVGQHQLVTTFESALAVASPGGGLVAAAPGRPVQVVPGRVGGTAERGVHAADLVHAQAGHCLSVASGDRPATPGRRRAGKLSTGRRPPL